MKRDWCLNLRTYETKYKCHYSTCYSIQLLIRSLERSFKHNLNYLLTRCCFLLSWLGLFCNVKQKFADVLITMWREWWTGSVAVILRTRKRKMVPQYFQAANESLLVLMQEVRHSSMLCMVLRRNIWKWMMWCVIICFWKKCRITLYHQRRGQVEMIENR